mgnify:CR=1 FL=1
MIEPGKYYKLNFRKAIIRAHLCTFCNARKVVEYKSCLFRKRGMINQGPGMLPLLDCVDSSSVTEVTETEYIAYQVAQHY